MPIYEYWCPDCKRRVSLLVRIGGDSQPSCPQCKGIHLRRLFSTFSVRKSEAAVYEDILTDTSLVEGLEGNDPRAMAEWNRRMGSGGDEGVGPEYEEMLERLEAGASPPPELSDEQPVEESSD